MFYYVVYSIWKAELHMIFKVINNFFNCFYASALEECWRHCHKKSNNQLNFDQWKTRMHFMETSGNICIENIILAL